MFLLSSRDGINLTSSLKREWRSIFQVIFIATRRDFGFTQYAVIRRWGVGVGRSKLPATRIRTMLERDITGGVVLSGPDS